ncbi:MAG: DUF975 family protein [Clostridia bacterium]|nr:DUF975 family protein [Clostridia bacterium]
MVPQGEGAAPLSNRELRRQAAAQSGGWTAVSVAALALGGVSLTAFFALQWAMFAVSVLLRSGVSDSVAPVLRWLYPVLALHLLVSVFAGSLAEPGLDRIVLLRLRGEEAGLSTLFYYRPIYWETVLLRLFMAVRVTLWSLLLIVPGVAALLNYAMAPFLLAKDPHMGAPEAIRISKYLMRGHKQRLLRLMFSYAGEILLSLLLLGIPLIWVMPRVKCAEAAFFRERVRLHNDEVRRGGA